MKKYVILFFLFTNVFFAQEKPLSPSVPPQKLEKQIAESVCEFPAYTMEAAFFSGKEGLEQFVKTRLEYPKKAKRKKTEGVVVASFFIEIDGSIQEIKILQSLPNGCDEAVIRLIKRMPKWRPALDQGRAVRFLYELPVEFKLEQK